MIGCRKLNQWKPVGATPDDCATAKKSVEGFLNYLASNMDHSVSQQCQIYQLEDIQLTVGETLMSWLIAYVPLQTNDTFPIDEKVQHVQLWFVHALSDTDVTKKLLALDLTAMTAKRHSLPYPYIATADNINAMGLTGLKSVSQILKQCPHQSILQNLTATGAI